MYIDAANQRCNNCYEEHSVNASERDEQASDGELGKIDDENNLTKMDKPKSPFTDFCRSTSLHGWQHLSEGPIGRRPGISGKYLWIFIVAASIGVALFFLFTSVDDFTSKYVVTNIDTTTAPLHVCCKTSYIL